MEFGKTRVQFVYDADLKKLPAVLPAMKTGSQIKHGDRIGGECCSNARYVTYVSIFASQECQAVTSQS